MTNNSLVNKFSNKCPTLTSNKRLAMCQKELTSRIHTHSEILSPSWHSNVSCMSIKNPSYDDVAL